MEDEDAVRLLILKILEARGYSVVATASPAEALALPLVDGGTPRFDLIVTDMVMPGGGGLPMVEKLRARLPDAKVLFVSGYAHEQLTEDDLDKLDAEFLQKPFTPERLARSVRESLDQS